MRSLLITEHGIIKAQDRKTTLGQIRRRQDVKGKVDFWEVRTTISDQWYGEFGTQEEAETELKGQTA